MKCQICGTENLEEAKFCCSCGGKLEKLKACVNPECPDFGKHVLPMDASFCPKCGHSIVEIPEDAKVSAKNNKKAIQKQTPPPPQMFKQHCPNCGYTEESESQKKLHQLCPKCNYQLKVGERTQQLTNLKAVICPTCGYFVESSNPSNFCPNDGKRLETGLHCANCGKVTPVNSKFCCQCGLDPRKLKK